MVKQKSSLSHKIYTYDEIRADKKKYDEVYGYIKKYGSHTLSYSVFQPNMYYLIFENMGLISYAKTSKRSKKIYVLGDPMINPLKEKKILNYFLHLYPHVSFVQSSPRIAKVLSKKGFLVNSLGVEYVIDVNNFKVSYNVRKGLKEWCRVMKKQGVFVEELIDSSEKNTLDNITQEWVSQKKKKKELSFMARPFMSHHEPDVRIFKAVKDGNIIGFCTFEPSFIDGNLISYSVNHMRHTKGAVNGVIGYIIVEAISSFKKEGVKEVRIGLAPLHKLDNADFNFSKLTHRVSMFLYNYCNFLYNFKVLGENKDRYQANESQTFFISKKKYPVLEIFGVLRLNKIL